MDYINGKLANIDNESEHFLLWNLKHNKKTKSGIRTIDEILGFKERKRYFLLDDYKLYLLKSYKIVDKIPKREFLYFEFPKESKYEFSRFNSTYLQRHSLHNICSLQIDEENIVLIFQDELILINLKNNIKKHLNLNLEELGYQSYKEISDYILLFIATEKIKKNYEVTEHRPGLNSDNLKSFLGTKKFENKIKEVLNETKND